MMPSRRPAGPRPGRPGSGRRASWPGARRRRRSWRPVSRAAASRLRRSGRSGSRSWPRRRTGWRAGPRRNWPEAEAKVARYAQRTAAAAAGTGRRQGGRAPWPAEQQRDVRAAAAAAARAAARLEAAIAAPAVPPALARPPRANVTDLASRVMPLKKGGYDQLYNLQALAGRGQVIAAIATHDSTADTYALHPLLAAGAANLAAAGISDPIGKALFDAGYAAEANFTARCDADLYVAVTRESVQAGQQAGGTAPLRGQPGWQAMAARLDTPEGPRRLQAAQSHHRAGLRPAVRPVRPHPALPRRHGHHRDPPVGRRPQHAQGHPRPHPPRAARTPGRRPAARPGSRITGRQTRPDHAKPRPGLTTARRTRTGSGNPARANRSKNPRCSTPDPTPRWVTRQPR